MPESVESALDWKERGFVSQAVLLRLIPTPKKYWRSSGLKSRYGMTFARFQRQRGALISSLAAFRARISALQEKEQGLMGAAQVFGLSSSELLAKYDPESSSLKTSQCSLFGEEFESLLILPKSGMMLNGALYPLRMSSGLEAIRNYPPFIIAERECLLLRLPTPIAKGDYNRKGASPTSGNGLRTVVMRLPTPNAGDVKAGFSNAPGRKQSSLPRSIAYLENKNSGKRGDVNPNWKEWLMGYPIGWTDLSASETPSCPKWQNI